MVEIDLFEELEKRLGQRVTFKVLESHPDPAVKMQITIQPYTIQIQS
ncbi:MAG: hypothetical protein RIT39_679, partial [Bacteroidota bacterium]|jgi:hypothetical protein